MKPLNIGIFVEHYEPFVSGVVTSVKSLRAELERRGHNVYIICPALKGYKDTDLRIIRIPSISAKSFDNATIGLPSPASISRLSKIRFDIIHAHDIFYTAGVGLIVSRKQRIPYIQTYHTLWHQFIEQYPLGLGFKLGSTLAMGASYPFFFGLRSTAGMAKHLNPPEGRSRLSNLAWGHMLNMSRQADAVVVPSQHLRQDLIKSGVKGDIHHIPNGVVPLELKLDNILPADKNGVTRIISVARFSSEKRLHTLIKAISETKSPVELVMAGDGPLLAAIEKQALKLGVAQKVRFMGNLSNAAVRKLMGECDALALASYNFDNQPMVILEAITSGLPIIYCDPQLSEGLHRNNSILTENSSSGFAAAFDGLDSDSIRSMAAASTKLAKHYKIDSIADQMLDIYISSLQTYQIA